MSGAGRSVDLSTPSGGVLARLAAGGAPLRGGSCPAPSTGSAGRPLTCSRRYRGAFPTWWRQIPGRAVASQRSAQQRCDGERGGVRRTSVRRRLLGSLERSCFAALTEGHPSSVRASQRVPRVPASIRTHHSCRPPPLRSSGLRPRCLSDGCLPCGSGRNDGFGLRPQPEAPPRARGGAASTAVTCLRRCPRSPVRCEP